MTDTPAVIRLADYREPDFTTDRVDLNFDVHDTHTIVTSKVTYHRTAEGAGKTALVLHAENPNPKGKNFLRSVRMNGLELAPETGYVYDEEKETLTLTLDSSEQDVTLEIETYLEPEENKKLTGLYQSGKILVTQNESEGFRRITPFLDRPDVMAVYTARIEAPKDTSPLLLANGNQTGSGDLPNGRHWATFNDPWPKPSYLFCTANGDMGHVQSTYNIRGDQNRPVDLKVYLEKGLEKRAEFFLSRIPVFMKYDEDVFDCEYDLDNFKVVGVSKFSFGAMENKGLNVFRDSVIMADPDIATDDDYLFIDVVGAHEYFHNWSGDRITVANWFHISLKEGLTVLREQMYTAHITSPEVERIKAVQFLRALQFSEDDSPFAHPVLPQEVSSIENCYSRTIYQKGAEVLRMMGELMGKEKLVEGIKHYFKKYDGQAVTIHEFAKAMEEVSGLKFDEPSHFFSWYVQSGRPRVKAEGSYDPVAKTYTLTLEQLTPPTKDQPVKKPQVIPVRMSLVDKQGNDMVPETVLTFDKTKQAFVFNNIESEPAFHSVMRGFSAIVDTDPGLSEDQLYQQALLDKDGFNRWDAGQKIALIESKRLYDSYVKTGAMPAVSPRYLDALKTIVNDAKTDPYLITLFLTPPSVKEFENRVGTADPAAITAISKHLRQSIASALSAEAGRILEDLNDGKPYQYNHLEMGKRKLKSHALQLLTENGDPIALAFAGDLYKKADNITDRIASMMALRQHNSSPARKAAFDDFYQRYKNDQLVIRKWFGMEAASSAQNTPERMREVIADKTFNWEIPGHVQAAFGGFAANYEQFHRKDGKGYEFVADGVIKADGIIPHTAAGMVEPLCSWRKYTAETQKLMIAQLERIAAVPGLSTDTKEKVLKSLPDAGEKQKLGLPGPSV